MKKIIRFLKDIFAGFKNLYIWFPIIWADRDFDNAYFEIILLHKLKLMRDFYRSDKTWCVGAEKLADQIDEVLVLLDRVINLDYEVEVDPHFNDWIDTFDGDWSKAPKDNDYRKSVYAQANEKMIADRMKAYELIAKNSPEWWD